MIPYEQPRQTLTAFDTALPTVASSPLTVLVVGDSVTERLHSNRRDLAYPTRVLAGLRAAAQPAGIPGGVGFIPAWNLDTAFFGYLQTWASSANVSANGGAIGIGCRASFIPVGATQTIELPADNTSVDLFWYRTAGLGTLGWTVTYADATTASGSFATAGATQGGNTTRVATTSAGTTPVSLTVTATVTGVCFEGAFFYAGDESAGIRLAEGGHTGATASGTFPAGTPWLDSVATIQPTTVIIELGINDWNGGVTAAAYATAVAALIAAIRARCTVRPSILLIGYWQALAHGTEVDTWQAYIAALQGLVSGPNDIRLLDLFNTCVDDEGRSQYQLYPTTADTQRFADIVHPSDWGHQAIANMIVSTLVTPAEPPGNPVPRQQLLVALRNGPLDDHTQFLIDAPGVPPQPGHWTDITDYQDHADGGRGRQQQTGNFESGTRTWHLRNDNGEFNTFGQSGLYTPYLDLGRPVKQRVTVGNFTSDRFTGHLISCKPLWPDVMSTEAELQASDLFRHLNLDRLGNNLFSSVAKLTFAHYWRCNDPAGATLTDSVGSASLTLVTGTSGGPPTLGGTGGLLLEPNSGELNFGGYAVSTGLVYNPAGYVDATGLGVGPSTPFTFMALIKAGNQVQQGIVVQNPANIVPVQNNWSIFVESGSVVAGFVDSAGGFASMFTSFVGDGLWHFVAVSYDGSNYTCVTDSTVGVQPVAHAFLGSSADPFYFGASPSGGAPPFQTYGGVSMSEIGWLTGSSLTVTQLLAFSLLSVGFWQQSADQRVAAALAAVGISPNLLHLDQAVQQVQQNTQNLVKVTTLSHIQEVELTEGGALFVTGSGKVRLVSRKNLATVAPYAAVMCTFGDRVDSPGVTGFKWGDTGVWGAAVWGTPPTMTWGAANAWGATAWGTADIAYQPGPDIGLDDMNVINEPDVTRTGGLVQAFYGSSPYGPHGLSLNALHLTEACSLEHAKWLLDKYSGSRTELRTVVVRLTEYLNDPGSLQRVLRLDLMHRVEVLRSKIGFRQVGIIEHIAETVTADEWTITLSIAVADTYPTWWWADTQ